MGGGNLLGGTGLQTVALSNRAPGCISLLIYGGDQGEVYQNVFVKNTLSISKYGEVGTKKSLINE